MVSVIKNSSLNTSVFPVISKKSEKAEEIKKIALAALKELVIGLAFAAVACIFCSNPVGIAIAVASVVGMVAINVIYRVLESSLKKDLVKLEPIKTPKAEQFKKELDTGLTASMYARAVNFALVFNAMAGILLHELGHALAALILFKNPSISINVNPWKNGVTTYMTGVLSALGRRLGLNNALLVVAAAGTALVLVASVGLFIAGHVLKGRYPQMAAYLNMAGIVSIINAIAYALTPLLGSTESGNDFGVLAAGGIHPLLSIGVLIGIPLLIKGMLLAIDYLIKHATPSNTALPEAKQATVEQPQKLDNHIETIAIPQRVVDEARRRWACI